MADLWLFLLAVLTILGTPGPTNTLLATAGATAGLRASLPLLLAELSGYLISIGLIRAVLGPILAAVPMLAIVLKVAVAAYLVWIAVEVWRKAPHTENGASHHVPARLRRDAAQSEGADLCARDLSP